MRAFLITKSYVY